MEDHVFYRHFARRMADAASDKRLFVYPATGCADGVAGDLVLVTPPFIITETQMDEVVHLLREAVLELYFRTFCEATISGGY